jgi:hypothetical protein
VPVSAKPLCTMLAADAAVKLMRGCLCLPPSHRRQGGSYSRWDSTHGCDNSRVWAPQLEVLQQYQQLHCYTCINSDSLGFIQVHNPISGGPAHLLESRSHSCLGLEMKGPNNDLIQQPGFFPPLRHNTGRFRTPEPGRHHTTSATQDSTSSRSLGRLNLRFLARKPRPCWQISSGCSIWQREKTPGLL